MTRLALILLVTVTPMCLTMWASDSSEDLLLPPQVRKNTSDVPGLSTTDVPYDSNATETGVQRTRAQKAFIGGIVLILLVALFSLGCKMNHKDILNNFRRPVNLLIGILCQFLILPLIGFGLGKISRLDWIPALGLFACSISPGGGASNVYTDIFKGDIELSAVMTFISSLTAFGTVPLWLLFMTRFIIPESEKGGGSLKVPFFQITGSLSSLTLPLILGLILKKYKPECAAKVSKITQYLAVVFIIYVIAGGLAVYWHIFTNLDWKVVLCSVTLPWIGFMIGGIISKLFRRGKEQTIAISLETGIQNTGIAIFLIEQLLPNNTEVAMISPVFYALSTPIPISICLSTRMVIERFRIWKAAKKENPVTVVY